MAYQHILIGSWTGSDVEQLTTMQVSGTEWMPTFQLSFFWEQLTTSTILVAAMCCDMCKNDHENILLTTLYKKYKMKIFVVPRNYSDRMSVPLALLPTLNFLTIKREGRFAVYKVIFSLRNAMKCAAAEELSCTADWKDVQKSRRLNWLWRWMDEEQWKGMK